MSLCAPMAAGIHKAKRCRLGSTKGSALLIFIMIFGLTVFIGQLFMLDQQLNGLKNIKVAQIKEGRSTMLSVLDDLLAQEITVRNSRFNVNTSLIQCLTANPSPCDERISYDMVLFAPNPPVSYAGGPWPAPPAGITRLAGGLNGNKIVYNAAGGRCDTLGITEPSAGCPIQAIVQFRPLCGGNFSIPQISVAGGAVCLGPAKGFQITVGVGVFLNNQLIFHNSTAQDGDARMYQISAALFSN